MGHDIDRAVEISRDRDIDLAINDLARITEGMPTLLERFLTEDETFYDWVGDALIGCQEELTICAMRPLFESIEAGNDDYADLGHLVHSIVMAHMETASREAE